MKLAEYFLNNNRVGLTVLILLLVSGVWSALNIHWDRGDERKVSGVTISTAWDNASLEQIEEQVTWPLEHMLSGMPHDLDIKSISEAGLSRIHISIIDSSVKSEELINEILMRLAAAPDLLPRDVHSPKFFTKGESIPEVILAITGDGFSLTELAPYALSLGRALGNNQTVETTALLGLPEQRFVIELNKAGLSELGITPAQLARQIRAKIEASYDGVLNVDGERIQLTFSAQPGKVSELNDLVIPVESRSLIIKLGDIATVSLVNDTLEDAGVLVDGEPALILAITKKPDADMGLMGASVRENIEKAYPAFPHGVDISFVRFEPVLVQDGVFASANTLLQVYAVLLLVVLLLGGWRRGVIILASLMIVASSTVSILFLLSVPLNQVVLLTFSLMGIGVVIHGLCFAESVCCLGTDKNVSCRHVADWSSLTLFKSLIIVLIAIILLCAFLCDMQWSGKVRDMAIVSVLMISLCWLYLHTLHPLVVSIICVPRQDPASCESNPAYAGYRRLLDIALKNRTIVLIMMLIAFIVAIKGGEFVRNGLNIDHQEDALVLFYQFQSKPTVREKARIAKEVSSYIHEQLKTINEGENAVVTTVVDGHPLSDVSNVTPLEIGSEYIFQLVTHAEKNVLIRLSKAVRNHVRSNYPGLEVINSSSLDVDSAFSVKLTGNDKESLFTIKDSIKRRLSAISGVTGTRDNWGEKFSVLRMRLKPEQAHHAGVDEKDISLVLESALDGVEITQLKGQRSSLPVIMQLGREKEPDIVRLLDIEVPTTSGRNVPLAGLVDIDLITEFARVYHHNGERTVNIDAILGDESLDDRVLEQMSSWLQTYQKNWDYGIEYDLFSKTQSRRDMLVTFALKLIPMFFLLLLLLVIRFNSARQAFIVLSSVVTSAGAIICALLLSAQPLNEYALLASFLLVGWALFLVSFQLERINYCNSDDTGFSRRLLAASLQASRPLFIIMVMSFVAMIPVFFQSASYFLPLVFVIGAGVPLLLIFQLFLTPILYSVLFKARYLEE